MMSDQKFIISSSSVLRKALHLQSLAPTNPHWTRVVGYGPWVIHKEGVCSSSGDINRLMMMNKETLFQIHDFW
jgi:hypothetical protein